MMDERMNATSMWLPVTKKYDNLVINKNLISLTALIQFTKQNSIMVNSSACCAIHIAMHS
jgi:hypothetical protein